MFVLTHDIAVYQILRLIEDKIGNSFLDRDNPASRDIMADDDRSDKLSRSTFAKQVRFMRVDHKLRRAGEENDSGEGGAGEGTEKELIALYCICSEVFAMELVL